MMSQEQLKTEIESRISPWTRLGTKDYASGARRVGQIEHAGTNAYLHTLMPPPAPELIRFAEERLDREIPACIRLFLNATNGAFFFHTALDMLGLPSQRTREVGAEPQPYDLYQYNSYSRPKVPEWLFVCGGYGFDGSHVLVAPNGEVQLSDKHGSRLANQKVRLPEFLLSELDRLAKLFDSTGRLIAPPKRTLHPDLIK